MDGYELQRKETRASDCTGGAPDREVAAWQAAPWATVVSNFQGCEYIGCDMSSLFRYRFRVRAHNFEGWSDWSRVSRTMTTKRRH